MTSSLDDYLRAVTPYLHPDLVIPQASAQIQALARRLPLASAALLECRLSNTDPDVDFHASFTYIPPNLGDQFLPSPAWQACQILHQEWMNSTSALHHSINNFILEFDLPAQSTDASLISAISPSPYIIFKSGMSRGLQPLIQQTLELLQKAPNPALIAKIQHCLHALPEGASLANIGVWLARSHQAVRLTIKEIRFEQLSAYLKQIGWNHPTSPLTAYTSTLSPFVDTLALAIDLDPNIHPKIGLECFATKDFHDQKRWQALIDHLVQTGLCIPAKRNALRDWSGFTQQIDCPNLWPANLTYGDLLMGSNAISFFWRRINHIKLVYQPDQLLTAKAYLAFGHCWMSRDDVVFTPRQAG